MNNAMPAPVAFFAFKRPEHTSRTLAALAANDLAADTDLYIFCDGPRSSTDEEAVEQVRTLCRNAKGFASVHVHEHSANQGLANSLTAGLDSMFEKHDRVIVFEDDVLASPGTLRFLNASLERYQSQPVVFSICAWSPDPQKMGFPEDYPWDVYFTPRFNCWGWASWRDRWQSVDRTLSTAPALFENPYALRGYSQGGADLPHMLQHVLDGKLSTWDVQTDFARFTQGRLGLSPLYSFTDNIGHDSSGTNCSGDAPHFVVDVSLAPSVVRFPEFIFVDEILGGKYRDFHSGNLPMPAGAISLAHIEKVEQELAYCNCGV